MKPVTPTSLRLRAERAERRAERAEARAAKAEARVAELEGQNATLRFNAAAKPQHRPVEEPHPWAAG